MDDESRRRLSCRHRQGVVIYYLDGPRPFFFDILRKAIDDARHGIALPEPKRRTWWEWLFGEK